MTVSLSTTYQLSSAWPLIVLSLIILLCGCAYDNVLFTTQLDPQSSICLNFYQELDQTVFANDAEDSGEMRVQGYPFLRVDRFLASFRGDDLTNEAYAQWLELLRQTDEHARLLEFANLPNTVKQHLSAQIPSGFSFNRYLQECGRSLIKAALSQGASMRSKLSALTAVPDDYQSWKRIAGLYPIARLFAQATLDDLHQELNQPFQQPPERLPLSGKLIRYHPNNAPLLLSKQAVVDMLTAAYQNPLKLPLLLPEQLAKLFGQFAPVWEIDTRNDNDRIGIMTINANAEPVIDTRIPTAYVKHAYSHYHGDILLQLIYQIWLPAREKTGWFDPYGGELDSVIWRITLSPQGEPIAYDSIHACGCYYLLFPAKGYRATQKTDDAEPVLSPKVIDYDPYQQRLLLRLDARTHYLQQVAATQNEKQGIRYRLHDYDDLRALRSEDGRHHNVFGPDGIIESSNRTERFLLWPFGVDSPGAMRQWGSHAIAFVGRRHFDDAFLLEKLLVPVE